MDNNNEKNDMYAVTTHDIDAGNGSMRVTTWIDVPSAVWMLRTEIDRGDTVCATADFVVVPSARKLVERTDAMIVNGQTGATICQSGYAPQIYTRLFDHRGWLRTDIDDLIREIHPGCGVTTRGDWPAVIMTSVNSKSGITTATMLTLLTTSYVRSIPLMDDRYMVCALASGAAYDASHAALKQWIMVHNRRTREAIGIKILDCNDVYATRPF